MSAPPRILLILRAGKNSVHRSWIWTIRNLVDVAISTYDDSDYSSDGVALWFHHWPGGKLAGVKNFLETNLGVFDNYDYFWLFEDDLTLPISSLRTMISLVDRFKFSLSAPALTSESIMGYPINMTNSRFLFRGTNFVEMMMPIGESKIGLGVQTGPA
jgi:hypothetical protein